MTQDEAARADAAFHDATADVYEKVLEPLFRAYSDLCVTPWLRGLPGRGEALDVGCGTGVMTAALAERGYRVQGVDHSAGMLALAERKMTDRGLTDRVELARGDIRDLPFESGRFDVVSCQGVLHHLPDLRPPLEEIARVLKPGGTFYLAEPCDGETPVTRLLGWREDESDTGVPDHDEGPIDAHELGSILGALGLEPRLTFWSRFRGVHRLPVRVQRPLILALSRPWARRAGNIVIATGRRPGP